MFTVTIKLPDGEHTLDNKPTLDIGSSNQERRDILNAFVDTSRSHGFLDPSKTLNQHSSAPWLPMNKKRVLFVELLSWDMYYKPKSRKTGEYYVSATWDYALRRNGFIVDRVSHNHYYERMLKQDILKYHRIFVRDPRWHRFYDDHGILCKVRPMYFFGGWIFGTDKYNYRFQAPFAENQVLSANREERNTFMGYFPHNLLLGEDPPKAERDKVGFLLGKKPEYFEGYESIISALLDAGFELHSTCTDSSDKACPLPSKVVRHGSMSPNDYAELMKRFSFMLGFVAPIVSSKWSNYAFRSRIPCH